MPGNKPADAGEMLRLGRDNFDTLVENVPGIIYLCCNDERYSMHFVNAAVEQVTGYPAEDFLAGRVCLPELFHSDDSDYIFDAVDEAVGRNERFHLVYRIRHRDGSWRWVEEDGVGVHDGQGRLLFLQGYIADITERKQAEEELRQSETSFRSLFNSVQETVYVQNAEGRFITVNAGAERMYGYPRDWFVGKSPEAVAAPGRNDLEAVGRAFSRALAGEPQSFEFWGLKKDGTEFPKEVHMARGSWFGEEVVFALARDVTERKEASDRLRLAASVFEHVNEGIMVTDPNGVIIDANEAFCRITGYARNEALGRSARMLRSDQQDAEFYAAMQQALDKHGSWRGETWGRLKGGGRFPAMQTINAVRDDEGRLLHYVSLFSDITKIKEHEKRLEYRALHDALTDLPNRLLLADRLEQAMARVRRGRGLLAVAYLDLDGFKEINDRHGHDVGDRFLVRLVQRLSDSLRDCDTLARLGGDEFVIVLPDLAARDQSAIVFDRLLKLIDQPLEVNRRNIQVSASIGIAFFAHDDGELEPDQLIRQADQAMYKAKQTGKNRYHFFDAEQERALRGHYGYLERIRQALDDEEFVLHYQPMVNMGTGEVVGLEALVRWRHPHQGILAPVEFLPYVENHKLGVALGDWVIETACAQLSAWRSAGRAALPISVNVSALQLEQADFVDKLKAMLQRYPAVEAGDLRMEILETSALDDFERSSTMMCGCLELGVEFALDDFGTGYSSLSYLKQLPVKVLKIDRSFVGGMLDDLDDLAILHGVLGLARSFQRQVIAEGVETAAQGEMLLAMGCEIAQGYAIARPMPVDELDDWLEHWRPYPAWCGRKPLTGKRLAAVFAAVELRNWLSLLRRCERERRILQGLDQPTGLRFEDWFEQFRRSGDAQQAERVALVVSELRRGAGSIGQVLESGKPADVQRCLLELIDLVEELLELLSRLAGQEFSSEPLGELSG